MGLGEGSASVVTGGTGATGATSTHSSSGSRMSKALGNDASKKQLQREYAKSNVGKIIIMHENSIDWYLVAELPQSRTTLGTAITGSSTKHTTWETPWVVS